VSPLIESTLVFISILYSSVLICGYLWLNLSSISVAQKDAPHKRKDKGILDAQVCCIRRSQVR